MAKKEKEIEEEISAPSQKDKLIAMAGTKKQIEVADLPGVGEKTAEKMKEAGFVDMMAVAAASPSDLAEAAEIGEPTAAKIIQAARDAMEMGYETATKVMERRLKVGKITTGSKTLDALLGGGVETGATTEFHGGFGSSKTQVGHQLSVNVQLPQDKGGLGGAALYIDTEATFRPERIAQMAAALKLDPKKVLENVFVARAYNSDHQCLLIEKAGDLIKQKNIKLIVVDSVTALFRADFTGRGELAPRQQKLNRHLHTLQRLADVHNVAVYMANQVMSRPDMMFGDPTAPIGGHIMGHFCLPAGTLVQMADGKISPIEKMQDAALMRGFNLAGNLEMKNGLCNAIFLNREAKEIIEIEANSLIRATPNHGFFAVKGFDLYERPAEMIKAGDYIAVPRKINFSGEIQKLPEVYVEILVKLSKKHAEEIKSALKKKKISRKKNIAEAGINSRQLRRILNECYPTPKKNIERLAEFLDLPKDFVSKLEIAETRKHRNLKIPNEMTKEVAQLLGYFLGDGCLEDGGISLREQREDVAEFYRDLAENIFAVKSRKSKMKSADCFDVSVNGVAVRKLFAELKENYMEIVSKSPSDVVAAFVKGFADAEGYVSKKDGRVVIGQMDRKILDFSQMLLLRFGINSKLAKAKNGYVLGIYGTNISKFSESIGLTAKDKVEAMRKNSAKYKNRKEIIPVGRGAVVELIRKLGFYPTKFLQPRNSKFVTRSELQNVLKKLDGLKTSRKNFSDLEKLRTLAFSDMGWEKVRKVTAVKNNELLYDITIPQMENFIANSTLVHNSTYRVYVRKSKGETRIARIIDSPNLPEGECVFRICEAGVRDLES